MAGESGIGGSFKWLIGVVITLMVAGPAGAVAWWHFLHRAPASQAVAGGGHNGRSPSGHDRGGGAEREAIAVPDVIGESNVEASQRLHAAGFEVRDAFEASRVAACTVVRTSPAAGTKLAPGVSVTIYVARSEPRAGVTVACPPSASPPRASPRPRTNG